MANQVSQHQAQEHWITVLTLVKQVTDATVDLQKHAVSIPMPDAHHLISSRRHQRLLLVPRVCFEPFCTVRSADICWKFLYNQQSVLLTRFFVPHQFQ